MIAFIAFSLRRAWEGFRRNGLMSVAATATMVLMLVLLSGLMLLLTGLNATLKSVEDEVQVVAYLRDSSTQTEIASLQVTLKNMPAVTEVGYVSKDQAYN